MISFFIFIIDIVYNITTEHPMYILPSICMYYALTTQNSTTTLLAFALLCCEDFIRSNCITLPLFYIIPVLIASQYALRFFSNHKDVILIISCIATYGMRHAMHWLFFGYSTYTATEMHGNLVVLGILLIYTLKGRSGNRFYPG